MLKYVHSHGDARLWFFEIIILRIGNNFYFYILSRTGCNILTVLWHLVLKLFSY